MKVPPEMSETLRRDMLLARRHNMSFTVLSREQPRRHDRGDLTEHGTFDSPIVAVELARTLKDSDVTVLADGYGPYWSSASPDRVDPSVLDRLLNKTHISTALPHKDDRPTD